MNHKITGCKGCPFAHYQGEQCNDEIHCIHPDSPDDAVLYYLQQLRPEWCPLKKESITITLIENE